MQTANIPVVGAGATQIVGSDSYAYEVTWVSKDGRKCRIKAYDTKPAPNFDYYANQEYIYTEETLTGHEKELVFRNGSWKQQMETIVWDNFEVLTKAQKDEATDQERCILKLIPGITKMQRTFPKINIQFGYKRHYSDPSF